TVAAALRAAPSAAFLQFGRELARRTGERRTVGRTDVAHRFTRGTTVRSAERDMPRTRRDALRSAAVAVLRAFAAAATRPQIGAARQVARAFLFAAFETVVRAKSRHDDRIAAALPSRRRLGAGVGATGRRASVAFRVAAIALRARRRRDARRGCRGLVGRTVA